SSVLLPSPISLLLPSFLFTPTPPPQLSPLSLHAALPILVLPRLSPSPKHNPHSPQPKLIRILPCRKLFSIFPQCHHRQLRINAISEEHTSELQSRFDLVCRLLLEKKNT